MNIKETKNAKTHIGARFRRLCAFVLAFSMLFGSWTPAIAIAAQPPTAVVENAEAAKPAGAPAKTESEAAKPAETPKEAPVKPEAAPAKPEETAPAEKQQAPAKAETTKPAEEAAETPAKPEEQKAPAETQANELEISPEEVPEGVGRGEILAPGINKVFYGATSVSGTKLHRARVGGKVVRATVHVTVTDKNGNEKANVSVAPTSGNTWSVDLPANVEIAEGDTVVAYQELNGEKSPTATATAQPSLANQITLTMPTGEIWIEKTNANLVSEDEQAEAQQMLKDANPTIANDIKDIKFSIDGTEHAYYEVTYTDGSTSGKIEATGLKIHTVTETSVAPTIAKVHVTDKQIIVTLDAEVPQGTKFYLIEEFRDGEDKKFCLDGNCTVDKSVQKELSQAVVVDGTTVTFPVADHVLALGKEFGIAIKEPHKFRSCAKSEPVVTVPAKVEVRDPHKLTDADKKAIDKAIRDANTVNGTSKMPDGTGFINDPAFIEFDKDGNVTIISPNDVEVDWDNNGNPIYAKNADGTYKLQAGKEGNVIHMAAKDLVKNLAPKSPTIAVDTDTGKVTVTPPAYEKAGDDTDLASYTLTYKDKSGAEQTVTATRDLTKTENPWSGPGVDPATGVITLNVDDIEVGGTLKAVAKDNGGLEGDENKLDSDPASKTLDPVIVSYVPGTGDDGTQATGQKAEEKVNKGGKFTVPEDATGFTAPTYHKFANKWKDQNGKEYTPGTPIEHLQEDLVLQPVWEREQVKVTYKPGEGGRGEMTKNPEEVGKGTKYKVRDPEGFSAIDPDQEFDRWTVDIQDLAQQDLSAPFKILQDTTFTAQWKDILVDVIYQPGDHGTATGKEEKDPVKRNKKDYKLKASLFQPASDEYEFIGWKVDGQGELLKEGTPIDVGTGKRLVAQWQLKNRTVSFVPGEGSGEMSPITAKVNEKIQLPESTFTPPDENMEFSHWVIDEDTSGKTYKAGDSFTVTANTTFKAIWKKIQVTVSYNGNGGSGDMAGATVDKGSMYKVLENSFKAPDDTQEFKTWKVDGKEVAPGAKIKIDKDTVIQAVWTKIPVKVSYDANGGYGRMQGKTLDKGSEYELLPNKFSAPSYDQEFKAWNVDGTEHQPGEKITVTKDTKIIAVWKEATVTVSFKAGDHGEGAMTPQTLKKRARFTIPDSSFKPAAGYVFTGWKGSDGKTYAKDAQVTLTGDLTLTAQWSEKVTITYDPKGGTLRGKTDATKVNVPKSESFNLAEAPTKAGDRFLGWVRQGDNRQFVAGQLHAGTDVDLTFVAKWQNDLNPNPNPNPDPGTPPVTPGGTPNVPPVNPGEGTQTVVLTFNPNGGNWSGDTGLRHYNVAIGSTYYLDPAPVREGYTFVGWRGFSYQPGDAYVVEGSHTFTAEWKKDEEMPEVKKPSVPSETVPIDRDALLRRLKLLWSKQVPEKVPAIPRAGVGTAERTASTVLFPVDLMPAKEREDD